MSTNTTFSVLFVITDSLVFQAFSSEYALVIKEELGKSFYVGKIGDKDIAVAYVENEKTFILEDMNSFTNIFYIGNAKIGGNIDVQSGDICIPNTIISQEKTVFIEDFVGENYDLTKFAVMLNGICSNYSSQEEDFYSDIVDEQLYNDLLELENLYCIAGVELGEENVKNIFPILDFILN